MKNYIIEDFEIEKYHGDYRYNQQRENSVYEFDTLVDAYNFLITNSDKVTSDYTFELSVRNQLEDGELDDIYDCVYRCSNNENFKTSEIKKIANELGVEIETYEVGKLDEDDEFYDIEERVEDESLDKLVNIMYEKSGCWSFDEYNIKKIIEELSKNEFEEDLQQTM